MASGSNEWQDFIGSSRASCQTAVAKNLMDYSSRKFKRTEAVGRQNKQDFHRLGAPVHGFYGDTMNAPC